MKLSDWKSSIEIAHRGWSAAYPENTLLAFEAAVKGGAKMLEMDLQFSADREVMIFHDENLERTTNSQGLLKKQTAAKLRQLDAGSWKSSKFQGEKIPLLTEILAQFGGRALLNLEIKSTAHESMELKDSLARQAWLLVQRARLMESVLFSSFDFHILAKLRSLSNEACLALNSANPWNENHLRQLTHLKAQAWNVENSIITTEMVKKVQKYGYGVNVYTVNDLERKKELFSWGVQGIFTDDLSLNER